MIRVAFSGLRHGHAAGIAKMLARHPETEIVAVAEEHPELCARILQEAELAPTYDSLDAMLRNVDFEILAIAGIYSERGRQAIRGLEAGKHIVADKPLCTRLDELARIKLLAREKGLQVMPWMQMRYNHIMQEARQLLQDGAIGWNETLVIVTGDHETGYLTPPKQENHVSAEQLLINYGKGKMPGMEFNSRNHTNSLIPFFANGKGAELFAESVVGQDSRRGAYIDNTAISKVCFRLLND